MVGCRFSRILVNDAFRALFGPEPAADYSVLEDASVERAGILGYIRQAFAGEATRVPAVWYDLGAPTQPGEGAEVRRVGVERQLVPLHDESGALAYVLAFFSERTEAMLAHVRLERALGAAQARFRSVQEMSPDGFMMFRSVRRGAAIEDFTWVYTNPAAERMLGRADAELVGRRLFEEMPGNRAEGLFDAYVSVVETGEPFRRELSYGHEGLSHAFRILAVRLEDGFAVTFEDVTERKRSEAEREALLISVEAARAEAEEQRHRAEAANVLKDEFLATISHELRTPLQAILGWSSILSADPELSRDRLRKGLEVIERNGRAQATIIEDILDVSRIITGKLRLAIDDVDVRGIVEAAVDTARAAAAAKTIGLSVDVPSDLGSVRADAGRLQQIVWNLIGNAVKFTPRGGEVWVVARRRDDAVTIRVTDTGKGIAASFLPLVFERFRQADGSSTRAQGGLGLGLAIVRHLAELHGGRVEAESEGVGRGASFLVTLPVTAAAQAVLLDAARTEAPSPSSHPSEPRALPRLEGRRLLIVDDEEDARELVAMILARAGADVRTAASAEAALEIMRSASVDIVITDIAMPGEDGLSLVRRLRTLVGLEHPVKAVALTASASREDRLQALRAGFDEFLPKPVHPEVLVRMVARLVERPDELAI